MVHDPSGHLGHELERRPPDGLEHLLAKEEECAWVARAERDNGISAKLQRDPHPRAARPNHTATPSQRDSVWQAFTCSERQAPLWPRIPPNVRQAPERTGHTRRERPLHNAAHEVSCWSWLCVRQPTSAPEVRRETPTCAHRRRSQTARGSADLPE